MYFVFLIITREEGCKRISCSVHVLVPSDEEVAACMTAAGWRRLPVPVWWHSPPSDWRPARRPCTGHREAGPTTAQKHQGPRLSASRHVLAITGPVPPPATIYTINTFKIQKNYKKKILYSKFDLEIYCNNNNQAFIAGTVDIILFTLLTPWIISPVDLSPQSLICYYIRIICFWFHLELNVI